MLQIITGKFFVTDELYVTRQRGVLYTNYRCHMRDIITTAVGTLSPVTVRGDVGSFIYEVDERLEAVRPDGQREFLMAAGIEYLIEDFAAVVSFALNITCTPNIDLARRLTQSTRPSLGAPKLPKEYIGRVFDEEVNWAETDAGRLQSFITDLVGLERKNFKSVMRAIRRYVHGLHRISDDPDLAYSLLVASIESLAQDFDEFVPTWEDYSQNKRQEFDKVLADAPLGITEGIHNIILKNEHMALGRRYREFVLKHLDPSFFRAEAQAEANPVRSRTLPTVLESAYQSRSSYVHSLRELPRILTSVPSHSDVIMIGEKPVLSFHGLARIARHVIHHVVAHAVKVEHEVFDYRQDLPNTVQLPLADQFWMWQAEGYRQETARQYLSAFLRQLAGFWGGGSAGITDIRPIIAKVERVVPGLAKPEQRLPLLVLYVLFHDTAALEYQQPGWSVFLNRYLTDFDAPSVENLILYVLTNQTPPWTLNEYEEIYQRYFKQRYSKNGLQYEALFETATTLSLAEAYRQDGNEVRAYALVQEAVENLPKHQRLLKFEAELSSPIPPIVWIEILLPQKAAEPAAEAAEPAAKAAEPAAG